MAKPLTGKFDPAAAETPLGNGPPLVDDEINALIAEFTHNRRLPACIPQPLDAIPAWWRGVQEPPRHDERPHRAPVPGGEGWRWVCPYHNRLVYTLRKFLTLADNDQRFILAAREDGIFWRGDDMPFFVRVIEQTLHMRKIGPAAYRAQNIGKVKRFIAQDDEASKEREAIQAEGAT